METNLAAPSHKDAVSENVCSRDEILRLIPQFEMKPLFLRHHLNREVVIGLVGQRGGGKSAASAAIGLLDHMLEGRPVWSNTDIQCEMEIEDETARNYGLNHGGTVCFQSLPLEKSALLKLDERYRKGCLVIEEINVQYANARKAMTNTNVDFNMVLQQLRKFQTSLVYNVIDEMFVDSQLRTLTDIFIRSEDTAFQFDNLQAQKTPGVDFKWTVYPMSGYLVGTERSYYVTHQALPPVYFHFNRLWGIYNDKAYQEKGVYTTSLKGQTANMQTQIQVESSPEMKEIDQWAWLEQKIIELADMGIEELEAVDFWDKLGLKQRGLTPPMVWPILPGLKVRKVLRAKVPYYRLPVRDLVLA